jgi:hypothetical protein
MFKKLFNISLFILFIFILFLFSEAVFIWKHPSQITTYGFSLSKWYAKNGEIDKSLQKTIDTAFYFHKLDTGEPVDRNVFKVSVNNLNSGFKDDYKKYMNNLPYSQLLPSGLYDYARFLYEIGLLAYKNGDIDFTFQIWKIATVVDPTLSFWNVELANLYLVHGNRTEAEKTMEECKKNNAPRIHCEDFLLDIVLPNQPYEPGFLLTESEKFFKFKSVLFDLFPEKFIATSN